MMTHSVPAMTPRVIVLAGMDCAFTDSWRWHDEALGFDRDEEYLVAEDLHGRAVMTDARNLATARWLTRAAWALRRAGVRVINASEGGLVREFVEARTLEDVIGEMDGDYRSIANGQRPMINEQREETIETNNRNEQ